MPKIDIVDQHVLIDFQIPEPPLTLHAHMSDGEIELYIKQELKKIYEADKSYLIKEMMKEDLYEKIAPKINNIDDFM